MSNSQIWWLNTFYLVSCVAKTWKWNLFSFNNMSCFIFDTCFFLTKLLTKKAAKSFYFIDYCSFKEFFALIFALWHLKKVRIKCIQKVLNDQCVSVSTQLILFKVMTRLWSLFSLAVIVFHLPRSRDCKERGRHEIFWIESIFFWDRSTLITPRFMDAFQFWPDGENWLVSRTFKKNVY